NALTAERVLFSGVIGNTITDGEREKRFSLAHLLVLEGMVVLDIPSQRAPTMGAVSAVHPVEVMKVCSRHSAHHLDVPEHGAHRKCTSISPTLFRSSGSGGRPQTSEPWSSSREGSGERAPSVDSATRKPYGSESDSGSSRKPSEYGDTISPAHSTEGLSDAARQKKSHPIIRPGSDLVGALAKLNIQRAVRIPSRPDDGGRSGQPVDVISNCWNLSVSSKSVLMYFIETVAVYRVDNEKGEKVEIRMPPKEKRALIQQVVNTLPPETIYDGGHSIYSEKPIPGVFKDPITRNLEIKDPLNRDQLLLEYRIMEVQTVSTDDVSNFIKNTKATSLDMPQDSIRLLDCILKAICKGSFESIGRNALFVTDPVKVVHDKLFSIHKGFITSVRPQWKVRVNIDMWLVGGTYSRRFTVHGFSSEPAAKLLIPDVRMSVAEYFQQHHNIKLKYPELPCVKVNLSRDVFMPMELLNILPYQTPNAKKSDIASEVIRCAAVRAHDRFNELQTFVNKMLQSTHPLVKLFGVKVEPRAVKVSARVLDTPTACFGHQTCPLSRGKWTPPAFFRPAGVDGAIRWAILSIPGDRNAARHQQMLIAQFDTNARRFRVVMGRPECDVIQRADLVQRFQQFQSRGFHFVLLVLYDDLNYPAIKRLGDLQTGMRTQCVRGRTLDKPNVVPNLLLKINGKLGGINWQINDILRDDKELLMVFGADVTHPAPTQTQQVRQSIAAVLGSVTPDLMRYGVVVRQQATTEKGSKTTREIIDGMEVIVSELLKAYYRNSDGRFPTRLIFYRDGVSEGQFENVLVEELASIQRACSGLRQGYEPAITYIVVQKRHHVRFQPTNPRQRNVDPGTVVDTHVTHPREFDFYLCSQEGIQGTSKPAHYHVLYDDSNWTSDALQRFTFFLCHAYMRCPRSVSYPAPTYYAHLAAFRARDWVSDLDKPGTLLQDGRFRVHESQMTGMYYL
ncbi:eukaryotic translation initiation factor 2C, partial [Paragonimus westermani]